MTKNLHDANDIPIGAANENTLLDNIIYEVEYVDGHKDALSADKIAKNMFAQVDEEGNRYALLNAIVDHHIYGSEVMTDKTFIK